MQFIKNFFKNKSQKAREKRSQIFIKRFFIDEKTKILDLGSESGSNINLILMNSNYNPKNIYIADINSSLLQKGKKKFGFQPVLINESKPLPFPDKYFDIVFCSSVIEHVTLSKNKIWEINSGKLFKEKSRKRQKEFAQEIIRLGKQYFVQTPHKHFIIESHSWLPFLSWLPRRLLIPVLKLTNLIWVKKTTPDWNLLNKDDMSEMFYNAKIIEEKFYGFTKSLMAVYSLNR